MIHHVLYPRSVLSNFFVIDISRSFSGFWPTNNHVQYHVNCISLTGSFRSPTRHALTSDLFSYQFLVMSSCFFFFSWLLKDDFLISHSLWHFSERRQLTVWIYVSKYATSSKSTVSWSRFNKWFNTYSLQSKSLNQHFSSNRFRYNEFFNQRIIVSYHRSRFSERKAITRKLQKFRQA